MQKNHKKKKKVKREKWLTKKHLGITYVICSRARSLACMIWEAFADESERWSASNDWSSETWERERGGVWEIGRVKEKGGVWEIGRVWEKVGVWEIGRVWEKVGVWEEEEECER